MSTHPENTNAREVDDLRNELAGVLLALADFRPALREAMARESALAIVAKLSKLLPPGDTNKLTSHVIDILADQVRNGADEAVALAMAAAGQG